MSLKAIFNGFGVTFDDGPSARILRKTITLTNAQIKHLQTLGITVVAAPASGYWIKVHGASLSLKNTDGAYDTVDATFASLGLYYSDIARPATSSVYNDSGSSVTALTDFLVSTTPQIVSLAPFFYADWFSANGLLVYPWPTSALDAVALTIAANNSGSGDYGAGHANNTMRVTVAYSIEPV